LSRSVECDRQWRCLSQRDGDNDGLAHDLGRDLRFCLRERIGVNDEKRLAVLNGDEGLRVLHGLLRLVFGA
jgi:hypothetical protein